MKLLIATFLLFVCTPSLAIPIAATQYHQSYFKTLKQKQKTIIMTKTVEIQPSTADIEKNEKDLEMNSGTDDSDSKPSEEDSSEIPTVMDLFYDFNGSIGFAIGSTGFILEKYMDNWLPYFRYGSLFWIWGSVLYSIPLLIQLKEGIQKKESCPWGVGDFGEILCYILWIVGCVFGGFFDEETTMRFIPVVDHTFLYGSLALAIEPLYQAFLFVTRGGSCRSRMGASKLCGSGNDGTEATEQLKFNWDRCFELWAMIFFCLAGVFGGFSPSDHLKLFGVYCWEVGSLFGVARSFLMLHRRRQGLKSRTQAQE